jgi:GH25 family lysozyme M1 (1,4-beta-N-acetylmuramidase)
VTLFFWDASDFDWGRGPMDLNAAKADGITAFTHKATEGTSVKHNHTGEALSRALNAGFEFIGAYHVVRSINVSAQVDYFLSYLDQVAPWWRAFPGFFMQVDLELWPYDQVSASTGMAFASALVAAQPKRVITYASRGQYGNSLTGIITPLWNAAYGSDPAVHYPLAYPGDGSSNWAPYSGWTPVLWQYGSRTIIGTQPNCDASAYRGSLDDLRVLIKGANMSSEWHPGEPDGPFLTQGNPGYAGQQRDTALAFAWQAASDALAAAQAASAKCDQILAALANIGSGNGLTPAELQQVKDAAQQGAASGIDGATIHKAG